MKGRLLAAVRKLGAEALEAVRAGPLDQLDVAAHVLEVAWRLELILVRKRT